MEYILYDFQGKTISVRLEKRRVDALRNSLTAFRNVLSVTPSLDKTGLYTIVNRRKVYFVCETGCPKPGEQGPCICAWTMVKAGGTVHLESMEPWCVRLRHRLQNWIMVPTGNAPNVAPPPGVVPLPAGVAIQEELDI